jgi:hypothetical protein
MDEKDRKRKGKNVFLYSKSWGAQLKLTKKINIKR